LKRSTLLGVHVYEHHLFQGLVKRADGIKE